MPKDNVIKLIQPRVFDDQLTEVLRNGARALLARAVDAEVADFLDKHADLFRPDRRSPPGLPGGGMTGILTVSGVGARISGSTPVA